MKDVAFVEKYRPSTWNDFVHVDKDKILKMLENAFAMPHLLFISSTPGTGKTTLAKLIVSHLNAECIEINSSKDRTLEVVRNDIVNFAQTRSVNPNAPKFIIMDEFDGMPKRTQEALRNVMEKYSQNCKFILTANDANKVHSAIVSRCIRLTFTAPQKSDIKNRLTHICSAENITFDDVGINKLIDLYYPSIRDMIKQIQLLSIDGKSISSDNIQKETSEFEQLWQQIQQRDIKTVRHYLYENQTDVRALNLYIWEQVCLHMDFSKNTYNIVKILADAEFKMARGATHSVIFDFAMLTIATLIGGEK